MKGLIIAEGGGKALAVMPDDDETLALGRLMALALPVDEPAQNVLLTGPLGAGKTTLARGLVGALPGGDKAQVSSPSFNIVNYYPTRPECAHFDLFRLEGRPADESLMEAFHSGDMLVIVEWAEYLGPEFRPEHSLDMVWIQTAGEHRAELTASGEPAERYLANILSMGAAQGDESR